MYLIENKIYCVSEFQAANGQNCCMIHYVIAAKVPILETKIQIYDKII